MTRKIDLNMLLLFVAHCNGNSKKIFNKTPVKILFCYWFKNQTLFGSLLF